MLVGQLEKIERPSGTAPATALGDSFPYSRFELVAAADLISYAIAALECWRRPVAGGRLRLPVLRAANPWSPEVDALLEFVGARVVTMAAVPSGSPKPRGSPGEVARWLYENGRSEPRDPGWEEIRLSRPQTVAALADDPFAVVAAAHAVYTGSTLTLLDDLDQLVSRQFATDDRPVTLAVDLRRVDGAAMAELIQALGRGQGFGLLTGSDLAAATRLVVKPYLLAPWMNGTSTLMYMMGELYGAEPRPGEELIGKQHASEEQIESLGQRFRSALFLAAHGQDLDANLVRGALCGPYERLQRSAPEPAPDLPVCAYGQGCRFDFEGPRLSSSRVRAGFVFHHSCGGVWLSDAVYHPGTNLVLGLVDSWPAAVVTSYRYISDTSYSILLSRRLVESGMPLGRAVAEVNALLEGTVREGPVFLLIGDPTLRFRPRSSLAEAELLGARDGEVQIRLPACSDGFAVARLDTAVWLADGRRQLYVERDPPGRADGIAFRWTVAQPGDPQIRVYFYSVLGEGWDESVLRLGLSPPLSEDERMRLRLGCQRARWLGLFQLGVRDHAEKQAPDLWDEMEVVADDLGRAGATIDGSAHARLLAEALARRLESFEEAAVDHLLGLTTRQVVWINQAYRLQNTRAWDARFRKVSADWGRGVCPYCGNRSHGYRSEHPILPVEREVAICSRCGLWHDSPTWTDPMVVEAPTVVHTGESVDVALRVKNSLGRTLHGTAGAALSVTDLDKAAFEPPRQRLAVAPGDSARAPFRLQLAPELRPGVYQIRAFAMLDMDLFFGNRTISVLPGPQSA